MQTRRLVAIFCLLSLAIPAAEVFAAGISVQSFADMASFQSSALYAYITGAPGGPGNARTLGVRGVRQGPSDVPATSARAANNATVTSEVLAAAMDVPDVFSLNPTAAYYNKRFVSLGTNSSSTNPPFMDLDLTPVFTGSAGGFNGYDLVVFDLGRNLATGSGNQNTESTTFEVMLMSQGTTYTVGAVNATVGNFINAILLDVTGIPGIPAQIDGVRITDVTGGAVAQSGSLDVDGALTLNNYELTPTASPSWGRIKALYHR